MKITRRALGAVLAATLLLAGCGGDDGGTETAAADNGGTAEAEEAEPAGPTMPDVVGLPVDEAVAQLEEAGFVVSTGIVRTTEVEPDLVYRSEPAAGRQVKEGQRITLRVSAEPRE
ncbi:MAG TPA: PASTA domain-containing protein [Egicoccus sp.]|nr:PASTA domain-containing protein [Egicoccus sp.]HSK24893.1 PASTA domain-containing protein [Egicoccus sp.]